MTVLVGLDQHRAQITAERLDTASGEISRDAQHARGPRRGAPKSRPRAPLRAGAGWTPQLAAARARIDGWRQPSA